MHIKLVSHLVVDLGAHQSVHTWRNLMSIHDTHPLCTQLKNIKFAFTSIIDY